jgi:HAE1 family hydrophobic/amphiphilic exporter-1
MELLPPIQYPEISVITLYPGAAPAEIEQLITKPIEEAVNSVSGIQRIRSESIEGASLVVATLKWGSNLDFALLKVREKVDLVKGILPQDVYKPIVARFDPNAIPIMNITATSSIHDLKSLRYEIEKNVVPLLERIEGVGNAKVTGGKIRQIEVLINRDDLRAYNISLYDIVNGIQLSHYNYPAGTMISGDKELLIRTIGEFKNLTDIENVLIKKTEEGRFIFLKQVAHVVDGFKEITSQSFLNKMPCINIAIIKESGRNTVDVCTKANQLVNELNNKYKSRITFEVLNDNSEYIKSAISNVVSSAIMGSIIAFIVLVIFIKSIRLSIIIIIAIPVSLLITLLFMNLFDININMMSLGGMTICVGMLVDCSIVIIETLSLKNSNKKNYDSIKNAIAQLSPSLISSTLTSIVIFLPLILIKGIGGALFAHLAITVTVALLASLFVSLMLIPALYIISGNVHIPINYHFSSIGLTKKLSMIYKHTNTFINYIESQYHNKLESLLENNKKNYGIITIIILCGSISIISLDKSFMPHTKQNQFIIRVEAPLGTPIQETTNILFYIDSLLEKKPEVKKRLITVGYNPEDYTEYFGKEKNTNIGEITIILNKEYDADDCIESIKQILQLPKNIIVEYSAGNVDLIQSLKIGSADITIDCLGDAINDIEKSVDIFMQDCKKIPEIVLCKKEIKKGKPELSIQADRDKLTSFGLTLQDIASYLHTAIYGTISGKYFEYDNEINIITSFDRTFKDSIDDIGLIPIKSDSSKTSILLKEIALLSQSTGYSSIIRKDQQHCITVHILTKAGISNNEIIKKLRTQWGKYNTTATSFSLSREMIETEESIQSLITILILSIILIFMIIASQFESFIFPALIMLSVPLSLCGSFIFLLLTGKSINIMSLMGTVILIGTIVNNAILLLDSIIQYKKTHKTIKNAIVKACQDRLLPIIMTSLTTICGLLPLSLGLQEGSDIQAPLAIAIIGGMVVGSLFIMLLFPSIILVKMSGKK